MKGNSYQQYVRMRKEEIFRKHNYTPTAKERQHLCSLVFELFTPQVVEKSSNTAPAEAHLENVRNNEDLYFSIFEELVSICQYCKEGKIYEKATDSSENRRTAKETCRW